MGKRKIVIDFFLVMILREKVPFQRRIWLFFENYFGKQRQIFYEKFDAKFELFDFFYVFSPFGEGNTGGRIRRIFFEEQFRGIVKETV
jgi:hypothetical protein